MRSTASLECDHGDALGAVKISVTNTTAAETSDGEPDDRNVM